MSVLPPMTAIILAGGKARRMGGLDKGWIELNGSPLIRHVLDRVKGQSDRVMINANRSLDAYSALGVPVIRDLESDFQGPLMGMATGLQHATTDWVLCVPCDTPYLPRDLASRLLNQAIEQNAEIAVAHDGERMQSVVVLIKRALLPSLQQAIAAGVRRVDRWYRQHQLVTVDFSDTPSAFINVNCRDDLAELQQLPKLLGFAAWSGTGKTTLLKALIPELRQAGIRVGVINHAHHRFDVDHPGKDSYELRKAGADQMLISSAVRWALMVEQSQGEDPCLNYLFNCLDHSQLDLVLVEGFKQDAFPKIELHRQAVGKPWLYPQDDNIIAIAADQPPEDNCDLPILDLNELQGIKQFVMDFMHSDK